MNETVVNAEDKTPKRLYRTTEDKMVAGVCGGIARYFNMDPTLVRVVVALLTLLTSGSGIIAYLVLIFVMPQQTAALNQRENSATEPAADPGPPPVFLPEEEQHQTGWPTDPATLWANAKPSAGTAAPDQGEQDLR